MLNDTEVINLHQLAAQITAPYFNTVVSNVNNQVVRIGIMTEPYAWHQHPNSDETFIGLEGVVIIETPSSVFELQPGAIITIPKNVLHRTRPQGNRSVNLTIESADMQTVFTEK